MAWTIEYSSAVKARLRKLDRNTARRITEYMEQDIGLLDNPRAKARKIQSGEYKGCWRYRVRDHRVICDIQDKALRILVLRVGRRDEVYR